MGRQLRLAAHANWLTESLMAPAKLLTIHLLIDPSKQNGSKDITPKDISKPLFGGSNRTAPGKFWPFPPITLTKDLKK